MRKIIFGLLVLAILVPTIFSLACGGVTHKKYHVYAFPIDDIKAGRNWRFECWTDKKPNLWQTARIYYIEIDGKVYWLPVEQTLIIEYRGNE